MKTQIIFLAFAILLTESMHAQCAQPLTMVGPQKATMNNQVFDHLQISSTNTTPAVDVGNFDGVKITNCWIEHYGVGIKGAGCDDLLIDHCVVNCISAPAAGPGQVVAANCDNCTDNILIESSARVHITNVIARDGYHNIFCGNTNITDLVIKNVNCYNPRGKQSFGGNAMTIGGASNSTISDFYLYLNPTIGWSEDLLSISSNSNGVVFKRGCVDGNNSPTGDGIMVEGNAINITIDSVDVLNQGNGVIGLYTNARATLKNIRIRGEKTGSYNVGGLIRNIPNGVCMVSCDGALGTLTNCLIDKPTILNSCCGVITSCGMSDFTVAGPGWTSGAYAQITNGTFTARGPIPLTCMPVKNGTVTAPPAPSNTTAAAKMSICKGKNTTLSASGTGTLGWYSSSTGGTYLGKGINYTTPILNANTTYYVQDSTTSASTRTAIIVTVNNLPVVTATASTSVVCNGNTTTLNGGGATSYTWTGGVINGTAFAPNATNTYTVTGTDANGCSNTNSITISVAPVQSLPGIIQGENYCSMTGVQNEACTDVGGGQNAAYINQGDWMDYSINVTTAGNYAINYRVASGASGAQFQVLKGSTVLNTINVPNTGTFQTWQTITTTINLSAGVQTLRILSTQIAEWNINWFEVKSITTGIQESVEAPIFSIYPNPFSTNFTLQISTEIIVKDAVMKIYDVIGKEVKVISINNNETIIDRDELKNGIYFYQVINNPDGYRDESISKGKLIIQ